MKEEMIQFAQEVQQMFKSGKSLREICQWSYQQRESGRNIPYLGILQKSQDGAIEDLSASPISKQKELKKFFDTRLDGEYDFIDKYHFFVNRETGVEFTERVSHVKGDIISLI